MRLSGAEIRKLVNAIISAYPTKEDLAMMVRIELEENLNAIAGGNNLNQLVFSLITQWAIPRGKIYRLILAAYQTNPDNEELKEFYQTVVLQKRFLVNITPKLKEFGPDIN
ncbi:effector-associated domain EAD1-containing protein [Limnospira fusiformis]|uniref:effector-associated domain EAD1-containing protein n=1 Tax=Limnospira fusiformis TaxID=54297 RepID=UPI0034E08BE3